MGDERRAGDLPGSHAPWSGGSRSPHIAPAWDGAGFRHEAFLYDGDRGFVEGVAPFILEAIASAEPVLVMVSGEKIALLEEALGADAARVKCFDMTRVGKNPARIIPRWRSFVNEHASGVRMRGVGEPVWASRTQDELTECQRHEALLNIAFDPASPMWLVCPYDTRTLRPDVIAQAERSHPFIAQAGSSRASAAYRSFDAGETFGAPLPVRYDDVREMVLDPTRLGEMRRMIARWASGLGVAPARVDDLVLAANEVATNSLRHAGGGTLRMWHDAEAVFCEVRDGGRIDEPLVGRAPPVAGQESGLGLYLVNQLCDLVQVRSYPDGTVVRLRMARA